MSYSLGSATVTSSPGSKGGLPNSGIQGLVIGNQSGFALTTTLEGSGISKTLYPGTADFFPYFYGFSGTVFWVPIASTNVRNIPGASITFDAVGKAENFNASAYPMSIAVVQAVSSTATGQPIFTASVGFGSTASNEQVLNVFNPANSGTTCTFHSAKVFTSDATAGDNAIILTVTGADLNYGTAVPINSHSGIANPPVSVCHATAQDIGSATGASILETQDTEQNRTIEFLAFPDNFILFPGNNFSLIMVDSTAGKVCRLTLKWTENQIVPPLILSGGQAVAQQLINNNNAVGTQLIESTPTGAPQTLSIFNDGSGIWAVDQSGVAHRVFTFNTAGVPLQIGLANDTTEVLDFLQVDQGIKVTGTGSGGFLDVSGASTVQTAIKLPVNSWSRVQMIGDTTIAHAGTSVSHSLGVIPNVILPVLDAGAAGSDVISINYGTASSTTFTAFTSNGVSTGNVRFFVAAF